MKLSVISCLALAATVTCGCGIATETAPAVTATRFYQAVQSGDGVRACGLLAPKAAESLQSQPGQCARAVLGFGLRGGAVRHTAAWGDEAQVRLADDTVFLHRYAKGWLIRGAGCRPDPPGPYDCDVEA
jgi:hypothetical protein